MSLRVCVSMRSYCIVGPGVDVHWTHIAAQARSGSQGIKSPCSSAALLYTHTRVHTHTCHLTTHHLSSKMPHYKTHQGPTGQPRQTGGLTRTQLMDNLLKVQECPHKKEAAFDLKGSNCLLSSPLRLRSIYVGVHILGHNKQTFRKTLLFLFTRIQEEHLLCATSVSS